MVVLDLITIFIGIFTIILGVFGIILAFIVIFAFILGFIMVVIITIIIVGMIFAIIVIRFVRIMLFGLHVIGFSIIRKIRQTQFIAKTPDVITTNNLDCHVQIIQVSSLCASHTQSQGRKGKTGSHQGRFHCFHYIYSYIEFSGSDFSGISLMPCAEWAARRFP